MCVCTAQHKKMEEHKTEEWHIANKHPVGLHGLQPNILLLAAQFAHDNKRNAECLLANPLYTDSATHVERLTLRLRAQCKVVAADMWPRALLPPTHAADTIVAWFQSKFVAHASLRTVACAELLPPSTTSSTQAQQQTWLSKCFPGAAVHTMTMPNTVHAMAFAPSALAVADIEFIYVVTAPALATMYRVPLPCLGTPSAIGWPTWPGAAQTHSGAFVVVWPKDVGTVGCSNVCTVPAPLQMQRAIYTDGPLPVQSVRRRVGERIVFEIRKTVAAVHWHAPDSCDTVTRGGDMWRLRLGPPVCCTRWSLGPTHAMFASVSARFAVSAHTLFAVVHASQCIPIEAADAATRLLAAATFTFTAQ